MWDQAHTPGAEPGDPTDDDLLRAWIDVGIEDIERFLGIHAALEQALRELTEEDDSWR